MGAFDGKSVIVTGGAKGIGRGICVAFVEVGASVVCADVDEAAGAAIQAEVKDLPGELRFEVADVSKSGPCEALVKAAQEAFGGLDVICNNVGIQPTSSYLPAHELPEEAWDRILAVNLKSAFLMTKYGYPALKARGGGVIINTASVQGLQSANLVSAYAASKGGILSLTRQLALDYAPDNIRVMAVNPGTIDTPLVDEALAAIGGDSDAIRKQMAEAHPMGRTGKPAEIANAVLFLASDQASFMTGSYVNVDGGMMAKGAWA
jgi:NAD(P)-dependent dehydrogenase (short-subunit alcohol dehydrogenase family)